MEFKDMMKTEILKLYSIETQLVQSLNMLSELAQNSELKQGLQMHVQQTQTQAQRLEQICSKMGWQPGSETCKAMQAMQQEAQESLSGAQPGPVTDAMIIAAAQKAEHMEIACYGTASTLAKQMGDDEAAGLLQQSLQEEKMTDEKLTQIAESGVNQKAVASAGV